MNLAYLFRFALGLCLLVISWFAFSAQPPPLGQDLFSDKVQHFAAFLALSLCLDMAFPRQRFLRWKLPCLLAYGLLIELVQSQVPGRDASVLDWLTDAAAISVYWLLLRLPLRKLLGS